MSTNINIPENTDILTEIPNAGDIMDFSQQIIDANIDDILEELEGCFINEYYHEDFV